MSVELPPVSLRDASADDLSWIAAQEVEIFGPAAWSLSLLEDDFRFGGKRYRIAERGSDRVGYAVYGYDGDVFHLMNLAVTPAHRRLGTAHLLMEDFLAEAQALGERETWLEVAVTNDEAVTLYRKFGFEDVRLRPRYYQPGDIDGIVMRRRSAPPHG